MPGEKQLPSQGLSKYWTLVAEEKYQRLLAATHTFAEYHLLMSVRDHLRYDGRTKQAKRAIAQGRLRLATATDEELEELAKLEAQMEVPDKIEIYKRVRAHIRKRGVKVSPPGKLLR